MPLESSVVAHFDNSFRFYAAYGFVGTGSGINYPLRGEKHSNWDGGMRVAAFVSGGFVPEALRGTNNSHTSHVVDWYVVPCHIGARVRETSQKKKANT